MNQELYERCQPLLLELSKIEQQARVDGQEEISAKAIEASMKIRELYLIVPKKTE